MSRSKQTAESKQTAYLQAGFCREGEGDCDADTECEGALVCGTDNCPWGDGDDCCRRKTVSVAEARAGK